MNKPFSLEDMIAGAAARAQAARMRTMEEARDIAKVASEAAVRAARADDNVTCMVVTAVPYFTMQGDPANCLSINAVASPQLMVSLGNDAIPTMAKMVSSKWTGRIGIAWRVLTGKIKSEQ